MQKEYCTASLIAPNRMVVGDTCFTVVQTDSGVHANI